MSTTSKLFVGLMSGTSLDGIDAALVDFSSGQPSLVATHYQPYDGQLVQALLDIHHPGQNELHRAAMLGNALSHHYADTVHKLLATAGIGPAQVTAIGNHGQTIRHHPDSHYTLQLGNHALLAELTGISVIGDFRSRDMAAGGHGAPLVPAFHQAVFGQADEGRALVNIGGIANITCLPGNGAVRGFDTGPGNLLMDAWIQAHRGKRYDQDGAWASSGQVAEPLLQQWLEDPYFVSPPPKSTGRDYFNLDWLKATLPDSMQPADVQATLLELTARSVADAIHRFCPGLDTLFVCGGGARNSTLLAHIGALLPQIKVDKTDALGIDADWVEAIAFAWLAWRFDQRLPGNLPAVTGAAGPRILGALYPA
ncbi:anhydro-N-acetylmuramic acid kinase [Chitinivorax sp. PXF-14]|uniref:anhydro-N-acetylmuramic acid kinase n=1 Tax=Chitinivorax sp. PXF-14 TaxID=3230488 RepID=UPI003467431F